jgi:intein/homing endonuclease
MTDDLKDLRAISLPFDVDLVIPQCHECVRRQLKKYNKHVDRGGKSTLDRFLVPCTGIPKEPIDPSLKATVDDETWEEMMAAVDIVSWAAKYLKLPTGEPWVARWYQANVLRCTSRRKMLRIARRTGKCIVGRSEVLSIDGPITAEKLFSLNHKPSVVSFDQNSGELKTISDYSIWKNGIRDTYSISTQYGKETTVTDNHPFLTMNQEGNMVWKETKELSIGEHVLVPASYFGIKFNESSLTPRIARLLGYLTGDGTLSYAYASRFTNINDAIINDLESLVGDFSCELTPLDEQSYIIVSKDKDRHNKYRNQINSLLDHHDMRHKATEKRVPKEVLSGSKEVIANFLAGYWDTDGWASVDSHAYKSNSLKVEIGISSASKQLAKDIQFLLLRLGIFSNLSYKKVRYQNSFRDNWTVVVVDKDNIERFYTQITLTGKQDALTIAFNISQQRDTTLAHHTFIPNGIISYTKRRQKEQISNWKKYKRENGLPISFKLSSNGTITRDKLGKFAAILDDNYLKWLSSNDFVWEKIINIQYSGQQETYDLNIPETSTMVVDNIISHNTDLVCVEICYYLFTDKGTKIIVAAPQKAQTEEIINRVRGFILNNPRLAEMVVRDVSAPYYEIKLVGDADKDNGSRLRGFAAGTKGKSEGVGIRGQDADRIYMEEMDYIDEKAITGAVIPILQTNPRTALVGFSTPAGFKTPYYHFCEDNPYYVEFHHNYKVLPHYKNVEMERSSFTEDEWIHEFLAEWGSSEKGVYKPSYIDQALKNYKYEEFKRSPGWRYCIGTDWNEKHGTEIAVLGHNMITGRFQVVETKHIQRSEFTQLMGVQTLLEMNKKWKPSFIYIDAGNGSTNYELLRKTAYEQRVKGGDIDTARLLDILRRYDSGSSIITKDPITHQEKKTPAKPFMVNASVRMFEQNRIIISSSDQTLEKQLRNYIIDRYTPTKTPVYGMEDEKIGDHRLDALNLAIVAFHLEFDDLHATKFLTTVAVALDPRTKKQVPETRDSQIQKNDHGPSERRLEPNPAQNRLFGIMPARIDSSRIVHSNRPGWENDTEAERHQQFLQRKRSRGGSMRDRPSRSTF